MLRVASCGNPKKLEFRLLVMASILKSHNKMEVSVSEISLSSRMGLRKGITNTSTNQTSKGQDYDSTMPNEDEDSIQRPDMLRQIQGRITSVEQSQSELQSKF
jgi:hypothetical protein